MKTAMIHMNNGHSAQGMANELRVYMMNTEKMDTQILEDGCGGFIVQGRSKNGARKLVGMSKAITAKISLMGDNTVQIEVGEGKWLDKAICGAVSWFVLWPLAVTAAVGAVQQKRLPDKIIRVAEMYAA